MTPRAVFLLNLIQDVNILRPLIFMARQTFGYEPVLLVSSQFLGRDRLGIWQNEIDEICAANQAQHHLYPGDYEASQHLVGGGSFSRGVNRTFPRIQPRTNCSAPRRPAFSE